MTNRQCLALAIALTIPAGGVGASEGPIALDSALDEVFGAPADERPAAPEPRWRPGHSTVVWLDHNDSSDPALIEFDPVTGRREAILDDGVLSTARPEGVGRPPKLADPVWRPDGDAVLLGNHGDPMIFDFDARTLTVLRTGVGPEEHAAFAPDGRRIAWVRANDLWVYDVELEREIRLTDDGSETVFNGAFDWVYTEELAGREGRAFRWSEDGSSLIWLRLDDGEIPVFHHVDLMETHTRVTEQRYPKPGDPSPRPSLHAITFLPTTGSSRRLSQSFSDPIPYVPRFGFTPRGTLWFQQLDRAQERLRLIEIDPEKNSSTIRIDETDPHWVRPVDGLTFLEDGSFLWLSRRSGQTHLYLVDADGAAIDLTPGSAEVTELVGVDDGGRFAWFESARPSPMERRVFRVDLTTAEITAVTPRAGEHKATLDPGSGKLLIRSSSLSAPPRWRVVDGTGADAAEVPVETPIPRIDYADHRFVEIEADDGIALNAMLLLPTGFDESRPYPVVVYTYGGPNSQVVLDRWPTTSWLFNHVLADRGFVVFALDNRGSSGRGRAFEGAADLGLGSKQLPDQLAGVRWLRSQPWVDPERIGIWGWSYGGYMASFALTRAPGVFAAGVAVAPVTDWLLYDSIYTERYMGSPAENPEGYAAGSVLVSVGALSDPLLVIHGTADDNVHVQHTLQLSDRAWREGVRFDLMLFPNLAHGIDTPGSRRQVFRAIADFFEEHLAPVGEPPTEEASD